MLREHTCGLLPVVSDILFSQSARLSSKVVFPTTLIDVIQFVADMILEGNWDNFETIARIIEERKVLSFLPTFAR